MESSFGLGSWIYSNFLVVFFPIPTTNDIIPDDDAFYGQSAPNTGAVERGGRGHHRTPRLPRQGKILDYADFNGTDLTVPGYKTAKASASLSDLAPERIG